MTRPAGYELRVEPGGLDLHRFEQLVTEARGAEPPVAATRLREALALWRGPPLVDFAYEPWAQAEIGRLEELRLAALEDRIDADSRSVATAELVAELERSSPSTRSGAPARPAHARPLPLGQAGRRAGGLPAARATLVERSGSSRAPRCGSLERAILDQDPELDVAPVGPPDAAARPTPSLRAPSTSFVGRKRSCARSARCCAATTCVS